MFPSTKLDEIVHAHRSILFLAICEKSIRYLNELGKYLSFTEECFLPPVDDYFQRGKKHETFEGWPVD